MKSALIGYTGFVGSNILSQKSFDDLYNSQNIEDIKGKKYELIVSAATSAERWKANLNPQKDWQDIKRLLNNLKDVQASLFVLISTIDVYPQPQEVNEDTKIKPSKLTQAYGRNRYKMEQFIKKRFPNTIIIRCPQLYGKNLKKNFVFDLIYDNALDFTHKDTQLQLYNLKNIWKDISIVILHKLPIVNFAVAPILAKELAEYTRGLEFNTVTEKPPLKFDMQTKYGSLFGSKYKYIYSRKKSLNDLKKFILEERKKLKK